MALDGQTKVPGLQVWMRKHHVLTWRAQSKVQLLQLGQIPASSMTLPGDTRAKDWLPQLEILARKCLKPFSGFMNQPLLATSITSMENEF